MTAHRRRKPRSTVRGVALGLAFSLAALAGIAPRATADEAPAAPVPAAPPSETKPKINPVEKNLEPLAAGDVTGILGKKVKGPNNEDLGLIVDVVVDGQGKPRAAIIDFGGFLGVGNRKIAIDWLALDFSQNGRPDEVELSLGRDDIQSAPEYKPDAPTAVMVATPPPSTSQPDVSK
jgi:hypothetical protein